MRFIRLANGQMDEDPPAPSEGNGEGKEPKNAADAKEASERMRTAAIFAAAHPTVLLLSIAPIFARGSLRLAVSNKKLKRATENKF